VNPKTETLVKAHLAERTASGKETSGAVSERVPADGGRAIEELRQHRGPGARAGCTSSPAVQMARSTGADGGVRGLLMFFWPSRVARLETLRAVDKGVFLLLRTDHKNITVPDQSQPWSALTRTRALRGFSS